MNDHELDPGDSERERMLHQVRHLQKQLDETSEALALMKEVAAQAQKERDEARQIVIDAVDETYAAEHAGLRAQLAEAERARDECAEGESLRAIERDEARAALAASEEKARALMLLADVVPTTSELKWETGEWTALQVPTAVLRSIRAALSSPSAGPAATRYDDSQCTVAGPERPMISIEIPVSTEVDRHVRALAEERDAMREQRDALRGECDSLQMRLAEERETSKRWADQFFETKASAGPASEANEKCGIRISGDEWCALPHPHDGPHRGKQPAPASEEPKR